MSTEKPENYFAELAKINVGEHIEKKSGFSYLSWAWAVDQLRRLHPDATWEVLRFDGKPYLQTELGYFVEVAVTVKGMTLSQIHPVLDNRNAPILKPNPFQINTSIQRCLVKAIALHGLGLYIYAGEDLPTDEQPGETPKPVLVSAEQAANLKALATETGVDAEKFFGWCSGKFGYTVSKWSDIQETDHARALNALDAKRAKGAA